MNITESTKLKDVLEEYPWVKEELPTIHKNFKMLNSPFGKMMIPKLTIRIMSERSGVDVSVIIGKLKQMILDHN